MPKIETYVCDHCGYKQNSTRKAWVGDGGRDFLTLGLHVRRGYVERWGDTYPTQTWLWCDQCCGAFNLRAEYEDDYSIAPLAEKEPSFEELIRSLIRDEIAREV